jgi:MinD-like ATPase involved in chromosome partitioning or flagellar assembly
VDLPTYTSIWRIEKRLYKLYDFRLPMPVPVGQIAVFAAITVPYVILLTILGLPFNHTLFWLYVLPPGVITWLATRPVLESKRLPELLISQVRYLGEPGIWCRMAPLAEKDEIVVTGKVWRRDEEHLRSPAEAPALAPATARRPAPARLRPAARKAAAAAQATPAGPPARVPGAAPAPRPRRKDQRGRPVQWPVPAACSAGVPPAVAADAAAAEIAHDDRQAPPRPAAELPGRHATRPGLPVGAPGSGARNGEAVIRPSRPDDNPPAARPAAASWPVKDPHAPASPATRAPAGPAWTPPVPPPPAPPVSGDRRMPGRPAVPPVAHPAPAAGEPVPATGDPVPAASDFLVGRADALAVPDTARPASPAGPAVSVPAQAAPPEPAVGGSAGPAGFFIGAVRPEPAGQGPAQHQPGDDRPAARESAEDRPAQNEPAAEQSDAPEAAESRVVEEQAAEAEVAETEVAEDQAAEAEAGLPEVTERAAAAFGSAEPEAVEPEAVEPETAEPDVAEFAAAVEEPAEPEAAGPEAAGPEAAEPEVAEPAAAEPEAAESAEVPAGEAPPDDTALAQPGFPPGPDTPDEAAPSPWSPPVVVVRGSSSTRPTMVERALSGPGQHRAGTSWREHVRVFPGGHGPGRPDMERRDRSRVMLPIHGPRLIVMLGCTVGAGQTVTTLMLADVLATLRGEPVAALDLNPGQTSLTDLARTSPAGTARGLLAGATPAGPGQRGRGRLDLIAHDSAPEGGPALADEEYARVLEVLTSRYPLTLTDPGASAVARVLSAADQLILVAPASADAARAVAMTMEWLDGHGYEELCTGAITVINGVSKRSMSHVEQAELVVRGRCRAIVRVPWDDRLGAPPTEQGISDCLPAADAESRFAQLRPPVQLAYTALAGVLVSALAVGGSRAAPPGPPDGVPQRWAAR